MESKKEIRAKLYAQRQLKLDKSIQLRNEYFKKEMNYLKMVKIQ